MRGSRRGVLRAVALIATMVLALAWVAMPAHAAEVDPEADRILRQMSDHLAGLQAFSVTTEASTEFILRNGQKLQLVASGSGVLDRKRGFHFRRRGELADMELFFDGRNLTLYAARANGYKTIQLEGGNDAALDELRAVFGIEGLGGADLLYARPYEGLMYEVESAHYIGEVLVGGVRAHHLAYRAEHVDWQIWVRAEGEPLPLRYVITSKWMTGAPQFTVQVSEWSTAAKVSEADVTFEAPEGARPLETIEFDALGVASTE
jgi:hypothetical protein